MPAKRLESLRSRNALNKSEDGQKLLQVTEQGRQAEDLAGRAQGSLQVDLRLRFIGDDGCQVSTHKLILLRAEIHLFLVEKILRALQLAERIAVSDPLRAELRESLLNFSVRGLDSIARK